MSEMSCKGKSNTKGKSNSQTAREGGERGPLRVSLTAKTSKGKSNSQDL